MAFPGTALPARWFLDLDGSGAFATEITKDVRTRDDCLITRGRADEASTLGPSSMTLTLNNRSGNYSSRNPNGIYYGAIGRNTPIVCSIDETQSWLSINQTSGPTVTTAYVTTPDAAALDVTGDIDMRFDGDLDTWCQTFSTAIAGGNGMELISKWDSGGAQRSYSLELRSDGALVGRVCSDGASAQTTYVSTVKVPLQTGRLAVRCTVDVNNGASGSTATFYTSTSIAGTWTQLGDPVTVAGTTSIFAGTAALVVLDNPADTAESGVSRGRVFGAQILNGIAGTLVANADFTVVANGATSFTDSTSKVWTLNGAVSISNRDVRHLGEIAELPVAWDISGRDIYSQITANGILRRLGQGNSPLHSTLFRGIESLTGSAAPVAYWPGEDSDGSATVASGLGGPAMGTGGTPDFAAFDDFACSQPIITLAKSYLSGTVPAYTSTGNIQVRFLLAVPSGGDTTGAVICRVTCGGTVPKWEIIYTTGFGGLISVNAYDSNDNNILTSTPTIFNTDGNLLRMSLQLTTSGSNVVWAVNTAQVNVGGLGGIGGTLTGRTIARATHVTMNPNKNLDQTAVGHITVQSLITSNADMNIQLNAYAGELAGARIARLCAEQDVPFQQYGNLNATAAMGTQLPLSFVDLLQDCAQADLGLLGESTSVLGISYRPLSSLYNQAPDATIPYASLGNLLPIEDDSLTRNDVTVSRAGGSSFRATLEVGNLSVLQPPAGVGVYDDAPSVNVATDAQLADQAGWRVHVGTVDEPRYPTIDVAMEHPTIAGVLALQTAIRALDMGDQLTVTGAPAGRVPPGSIAQIVQGYREVIQQRGHHLTFNCSPASPLTVGVYKTSQVSAALSSRYASDGSVLAAAVTSTTATSISVSTPSGPLWSQTARMGFPITVGGEVMTVSAIGAPSGTTQVFTVARSVNGIVKTHAVNEVVDFAVPAIYRL